ncbi:hypothetical protein KIM372_01000 [Bombiscardovia nodaiensis]|uniref:Antitoxin SocA-like Panacea domain-containing protein n=1 Tax=Bombiscardovia nodaiensis TaxID=2932181 RepID=A0ABM8B699_9BIFI|nr:hypothetical protein KIM372_01000 [Bombiscardovia nodaiensis]
MVRAIDVADFFVIAAQEDHADGMTNMKVNKLLYFAQAASLRKSGKPLFDDPIEAWQLGRLSPMPTRPAPLALVVS